MFVSKDAREALAEYLERKRAKDANEATESEALFLSAVGLTTLLRAAGASRAIPTGVLGALSGCRPPSSLGQS